MLSVALAQSAAVRKSGAGGGSDNSLALGMTRKFLFNNIECREQDIEQDDADGDGIDLGGGGGGGGSESAGPGFIGGDINDLESFSEHCYGSLHFATLETLPGVGGGEGGISFPADDEAALNCAALLGRAQGLATALRAVPFNLSRGRLLLPRKLLLRHGVDEEALLQEQVGFASFCFVLTRGTGSEVTSVSRIEYRAPNARRARKAAQERIRCSKAQLPGRSETRYVLPRRR